MRRSLQLMICAAVLVAAGPGALARPPRVALTKVAGDNSRGGVARAVTEALDDGSLIIVPAQRVDRAIGRLGLDDAPGDRDIARLADELEVDAVIRGAFDRKARKMRFTIFANGKKGKTFALLVSDPQSTKFRTLVHDVVTAKLAAAVPPESQRGKRLARRIESNTAKVAISEPAPAAEVKDAPPMADSTSAVSPDEETFVTASPSSATSRSASPAAVRAALGMSVSARSFDYDASGTTRPPRYRTTAVPGARFEAEVYPFALNDPQSGLAGLGLGGEIDQTIGLGVPAPDGSRLATTQREFAIGVRYRFAFGSEPTSPTLTLGAGFGVRSFIVDRAALMTALDLPDVEYQGFDPGLALRWPLGASVALTASARGFLAISAGPIQRADQYGGTQVFGGMASAGLDILFTDRIALRVTGEVTQLQLGFSGNGALSNRDGDASTSEVRGATDRTLGAAATLAVYY